MCRGRGPHHGHILTLLQVKGGRKGFPFPETEMKIAAESQINPETELLVLKVLLLLTACSCMCQGRLWKNKKAHRSTNKFQGNILIISLKTRNSTSVVEISLSGSGTSEQLTLEQPPSVIKIRRVRKSKRTAEPQTIILALSLAETAELSNN